jgi:ectoine hydroxylase-related dioxygenase (phytanoyl-CoA dioxygenase family)
LPSYKGIIQSEAYEEEVMKVMADTQPVDCCGSEGDVVLWHHRLGHMAGHNYSNKMRLAVLGDFIKQDLDENRAKPPQENMWQDWSESLNAASETYSDETARSQKLID